MSEKSYFYVAGIVFSIVAVVQLFRIFGNWDVTVDGEVIPIWVSWVAVIVAAILAASGLLLASEDRSHRL